MNDIDQAPAADPALDAVARQEQDARDLYGPDGYDPRPGVFTAALADLAIIRDALADRITPAEARAIVSWGELVERRVAGRLSPGETALIARLGKIAEAGR